MLELQRSQQQKQMLLTDGAGGPGSPGKSPSRLSCTVRRGLSRSSLITHYLLE